MFDVYKHIPAQLISPDKLLFIFFTDAERANKEASVIVSSHF